MNLKPLVVYLVFVLSLLKLKLARDGLSNFLLFLISLVNLKILINRSRTTSSIIEICKINANYMILCKPFYFGADYFCPQDSVYL